MSEQAVQTAPAGEAAPANEFNTVTWAEPGTVANTPAPEPVAVPDPEPADPDFNYVTLENGEIEARLATGEVYKGKSEREVSAKIAKGKVEASRHIQTLHRQPPPQQIDANTVPVDQSSKVLLDLLAPSLGAKDGATLAQTLQHQQQVIQEFQMQQTAAQFFQENPDFPKVQANTDKFGETLDKFGLTFTPQNANLVHHYLKSTGQYVAAAPPVPRAADGTFAPRTNTMPAPPNGSSATPSAAVDEAAIWRMSPQEFAEYRSKFSTQ